jgi:hypothetical protein
MLQTVLLSLSKRRSFQLMGKSLSMERMRLIRMKGEISLWILSLKTLLSLQMTQCLRILFLSPSPSPKLLHLLQSQR